MSKEEQSGPVNQNTPSQSLLGSLAIQTTEKIAVDHPSNLVRTKSDNNAIPGSPTTQRLRMYQLQKANSQTDTMSRPGALAREGSRSGHARTSSFEKGKIFTMASFSSHKDNYGGLILRYMHLFIIPI